ncbi:MAG: GHKL domain-containing protein [Planctomycetales bacterium]|nr:GHKL domain-containing protein [Planctomycetales bacterium]
MNKLRSISTVSADRAVYLSLELAALVFAIDVCLPLGVASGVLYTFAVLLALNARSRQFAFRVALLCCVLTVGKVLLFPDRGSTELWKVLTNRGLALFAIGMTAFLGMKRRKAEDKRRFAEEKTREHLADLAHVGRLKTAGQLAESLAHELNQPLAAISLQAEIAEQLTRDIDAGQHTALRSSLTEIVEESQRAAAIIRTLRSLVVKTEPQRDSLDINEIVNEVVRLIDSQARRADVALHIRLAQNLPTALGDKIQLEQVLLNLVQNAIEAITEVGGDVLREIELKTSLDDENFIRVTVRDTGVGLCAEDAERLFDRFYSSKPTGMGMGLAISRSIVEAHGGRLWGEANSDRGATFVFTLPIARRASS